VALPRSDLLHSGPAITGVFIDLSNFAVKLQPEYFLEKIEDGLFGRLEATKVYTLDV
jgi:hypothetical protein